MTEKKDSTKTKSNVPQSRNEWMALGVGMGVALGAGLGAAMSNIGIGVAIGVAIGPALGIAMDRIQKSKNKE